MLNAFEEHILEAKIQILERFMMTR